MIETVLIVYENIWFDLQWYATCVLNYFSMLKLWRKQREEENKGKYYIAMRLSLLHCIFVAVLRPCPSQTTELYSAKSERSMQPSDTAVSPSSNKPHRWGCLYSAYLNVSIKHKREEGNLAIFVPKILAYEIVLNWSLSRIRCQGGRPPLYPVASLDRGADGEVILHVVPQTNGMERV